MIVSYTITADVALRTTDAQLHRFMLTMYRARNAEIHGDGHLNGNLHRLSGRPTNVLHDALDDAELVMRRAILAAFDEHRPGF